MTPDDLASESSKHESVAVDGGANHPTAFRDGGRGTRGGGAPMSRDHAFFLRVAHENRVQAELMKSSAIKLAESQKLLAEVDALLRR